jgi:putative SOS response-associated peptidase YedK
MCFSVSIKTEKIEKVGKIYGEIFRSELEINFQDTEAYTPYYFVSGFNYPKLPIIKNDGIDLYHWGFIPDWIHETDKALQHRSNTLNAVSETIFKKASFKEAILNQRCIIPVNGFFEWKTLGSKKIPYYISPTDTEFFSIGGIYNLWQNKQANLQIGTFSILTTQANPLMADIHNTKKRMPLIIATGDEPRWIDVNASTNTIQSLMQPFDEKQMTAYTISKLANNARNNRNIPEILQPVRYEEEQQLSLF